MALELQKTVVMVGMMGAGKSAVGRAMADRLGVAFKDSDDEIERAANMRISEIFARDGEQFFREREFEVIRRLLEGGPCVLSTGGGAFLAARNREVIAKKGVSVWLRADIELLWERVRHKDTRPLLRTSDPRASLEALYRERVPKYALAELAVDACMAYSIADMSAKVILKLQDRPDVFRKIEAPQGGARPGPQDQNASETGEAEND